MGAVLLLGGGLAGCAGSAAPVATSPPAAECLITDDDARSSIQFALAHAPDAAHAPVAANAAERFVFRQLYQTLVRVDCTGTVRPGLAESWSAEQNGRVWQFRLNSKALFWDDTPVSARAVVESWSANPGRTTSPAFANVSVLGEHDLRVELNAPAGEPWVFAHPDLAVMRRLDPASWPAGSGALRIDTVATARTIRLVPRTPIAGLPGAIEFRVVPGVDARRALDARVDALVTADAATLDYARALPEYTVQPLAWNLTYVIAGRAPTAAPDSGRVPADALQGLARAVVRAETRAAQRPFWWQDAGCAIKSSTNESSVSSAAASNAIMYPRSDSIARGLAERLVALAWPASNAPAWLRALLPADYARAGAPVAQGVDEPALLTAVQSGRALALVLSMPRLDGASCAAPALTSDQLALQLARRPDWQIMALLDTRSFFVHRGGLGRTVLDGDNVIRFQARVP